MLCGGRVVDVESSEDDGDEEDCGELSMNETSRRRENAKAMRGMLCTLARLIAIKQAPASHGQPVSRAWLWRSGALAAQTFKALPRTAYSVQRTVVTASLSQ
jgi:hypothetical protein